MARHGPWSEPVGVGDSSLPGLHEQLFHTLFDAIPSSVLLLDQRLRIVMANHNFLQKSRRRAEDTIGHPFEDVFPPTVFERTRIRDCVCRVFECNEQSRTQRMTFRAPGVPMRTYYFRVVPLLPCADQVQYAVLLMEDITEQVRLSQDIQRVERHLASVVESASDVLLSTDRAGLILSWNRAAEQLTGAPASEVIGQPLCEVFVPNDAPAIARTLAEAHRMTGSCSAEWSLLTQAEVPIAVSWTLAPMRNAEGETTGLVAAGRDLSERHRLEAQLLRSQKLAALGVMAGGIAHEIRNPLAVCSSSAQFLLEAFEEADADAPDAQLRRDCLSRIIAGIHKASEIIENLLRFARTSANEKMTLVDLGALLGQALSVVDHQAHLNRLEVVTAFCPEPILVRGVPSLLETACINMMLNSIAAMPDGGKLTVALNVEDAQAVIRIIDTGVGIEAHDVGRVFDPFYTKSPVGKGTGLGLSICYSIIQQHQGSIEVESEPGIGTCFCVHLPLP